MSRPSKKEIKAALDKLKEGAADHGANPKGFDSNSGKLESKKNSKTIRKQGV